MRILLAVLALIALGAVALIVYSYTVPAPETEVEEVLPDDRFPK